MAGNFTSPDGDLANIFVTDYQTIDQFAMNSSLWLWGINTYGEIGDNTRTGRNSPVQTIAAGINWSSVAVGLNNTHAIKTDGTLWSWGRNNYGQLGDNSSTDKSSPVQTVAGGTTWKQVSASNSAVAAIKTDGTLWTWGYNYNYALGDGTATPRSSPVQTIASGNNWKQVSVGAQGFMSAVRYDGTLWTWGYNNYGQLGNGQVDTGGYWQYDASSPIQTIAGGTNWKQVSCGQGHVAAVKTDGTLWLWGRNYYGQLGNNSSFNSADKSSPVQTVAGGTNWLSVNAYASNTSAIKTDGSLWLWGYNAYGQLGDNTSGGGPTSTNSKSSPVQTVAGGTNWKQVACGTYHTVALKTDGTAWSWGNNNYGNLGDGTTTKKSSPVQTISGGTNWKQIAASTYQSVGVYFYDAGNLYPSS